jgi:lipopolysaccharide transport system ATP-binding protein
MSSELSQPAISVRGISKRYQLGERDVMHGSLRDAIVRRAAPILHVGRRRARPTAKREWISALENVTFDVTTGEVVGVIGRNGAGKTTLLKILSGITDPTAGEAKVWGRIGALLEVGTGFHPDLTGRENVFLNGAILGMRRREIERNFDEIVAFAEVERFIDTPVKRYSSGMQLRLAFAVAAHLEPEILIVDEILAVGDASFQRKCLGKMGEVSGAGRTVLLVSHNMSAITQLANRCIWLDSGRIREIGVPADVVAHYLSDGHTSLEPGYADLRGAELRQLTEKQTHKDVLFESVRLIDAEGDTSGVFFEHEPLRIELGLRSGVRAERLEILVKVFTLEGALVCTLLSGLMEIDLVPGPLEVAVEVPRLSLRPGRYQLDLYVLTSLPQDDIRGAIEFDVAGARGGPRDPRHARDYLGVVTVDHEWSDVRQRERTHAG